MTREPDDSRAPTGAPVRHVLLIGAWLGLLAGLGEGPLSLLLLRLGRLREIWYDVLWVAPAFDMLFGVAAASGLAGIAWLVHRGASLRWGAFGGGFILASIWLSLLLPYQVHTWALLLLSAGVAFQFSRWFAVRQEAGLRFFRRSFPVLVGCALVLGLGIRLGGHLLERWRTARLPVAAANAPDILVIVIDALRGDHVGMNGYERPVSPVLDSIAASGASFQAAFSPAPYTAPAHGSLLTGLLPGEHGAQWRERSPALDRLNPTLPERLLAIGYRTGAFSANRFWFTREQGFGRGFLHFEDRYHHAGDMMVRTAYGRKLEQLVFKRFLLDDPWRKKADEVTDAVLQWVEDHEDRPFFAFLNYFDVHDPYLPPEPYGSRFAGRPHPGGRINSFRDIYSPDLSAAELQEEIDAYDGTVSYVDAEIGRLLRALRESGLADDLLVIVTSDHGEAFNEHGTYVHANSLYFEEIYVPLVIARPGQVPAGFRTGTAVTTASLPATILDLAGAPADDPHIAPSLAALWQDSSAVRDWPLAAAQMEPWPWMPETSPSHFGAITSVQDSQYHFILHDSLGSALFDWRSDPREEFDLLASGENGVEARRLAERLERTLARCREVRPNCGIFETAGASDGGVNHRETAVAAADDEPGTSEKRAESARDEAGGPDGNGREAGR